MADIDYTLSLNGFEVDLGDNPNLSTGNKLLSNRFTITFLTNTKTFLLGSVITTDTYGGDANKYIGQPQALNNIQSIATSISTAMNKTVDSIKNNQSDITDPTEKIDNAELLSVEIVGDTVYATIKINPIAYSSPNELYFTIPVRGV
jgi:hypothetical protein